MGWTYTHKDAGESVFDFFKKRFDYSRDDGRYGKVIACAVKNLRTAYLAYEINSPDRGKEVVALVCLLGYAPKDYYNFGYKEIDESMGPCETECPEKILKLLTPTESEWANEWRKRCWENIKKGKTRIKLTEGNQVRSPEPINFTNGKAYQEFVVVDAKRSCFAP
ncbi:DUF6927 domain-containing protein [Syntrophomonas palmitatica]|uniref:DUF6927 domain-containing protein n=1 Tax=Syntrophomonas palmitatica TaxID=402877 RepID=UPI0006D2744B|nr:hypothetical protein [Syntrophomonas palmitatica]